VEHINWRRNFVRFIEDLFQLIGCAPPEFDSAPGDALTWDIEIDGALFTLRHEAAEMEDQMFVRCRFGQLPTGQETTALFQLMAFNLDLADSRSGVFGLDRNGSEVQFAFRRQLENASPESFLDECCRLAVLVEMWTTDPDWVISEPARPIEESEFASLA
jgi:hypothetical protein